MSISVEVGLLSGKRAFVDASLDEEVGTLKLGQRSRLKSEAADYWIHMEVFWIHVRRSRQPVCGMVIR